MRTCLRGETDSNNNNNNNNDNLHDKPQVSTTQGNSCEHALSAFGHDRKRDKHRTCCLIREQPKHKQSTLEQTTTKQGRKEPQQGEEKQERQTATNHHNKPRRSNSINDSRHRAYQSREHQNRHCSSRSRRDTNRKSEQHCAQSKRNGTQRKHRKRQHFNKNVIAVLIQNPTTGPSSSSPASPQSSRSLRASAATSIDKPWLTLSGRRISSPFQAQVSIDSVTDVNRIIGKRNNEHSGVRGQSSDPFPPKPRTSDPINAPTHTRTLAEQKETAGAATEAPPRSGSKGRTPHHSTTTSTASPKSQDTRMQTNPPGTNSTTTTDSNSNSSNSAMAALPLSSPLRLFDGHTMAAALNAAAQLAQHQDDGFHCRQQPHHPQRQLQRQLQRQQRRQQQQQQQRANHEGLGQARMEANTNSTSLTSNARLAAQSSDIVANHGSAAGRTVTNDQRTCDSVRMHDQNETHGSVFQTRLIAAQGPRDTTTSFVPSATTAAHTNDATSIEQRNKDTNAAAAVSNTRPTKKPRTNAAAASTTSLPRSDIRINVADAHASGANAAAGVATMTNDTNAHASISGNLNANVSVKPLRASKSAKATSSKSLLTSKQQPPMSTLRLDDSSPPNAKAARANLQHPAVSAAAAAANRNRSSAHSNHNSEDDDAAEGDSVERRIARSRERNREHARKTRLRKKAQMEDLQRKVKGLQAERKVLQQSLQDCSMASILVGMSSCSSSARRASEPHSSPQPLQQPNQRQHPSKSPSSPQTDRHRSDAAQALASCMTAPSQAAADANYGIDRHRYITGDKADGNCDEVGKQDMISSLLVDATQSEALGMTAQDEMTAWLISGKRKRFVSGDWSDPTHPAPVSDDGASKKPSVVSPSASPQLTHSTPPPHMQQLAHAPEPLRIKIDGEMTSIGGEGTHINWKSGVYTDRNGSKRRLTQDQLQSLRRERNRMHAKMTRDRKKSFIQTMERTIHELQSTNRRMKDVLQRVTVHHFHSATVLPGIAPATNGDDDAADEHDHHHGIDDDSEDHAPH